MADEHSNPYVEVLARYLYGSGESLHGTEWHDRWHEAARQRAAGLRWDEVTLRVRHSYWGIAETVLGPAIRKAAAIRRAGQEVVA